MSVGQRLRQRRMELNMTQAELARRLGVTPAVVSNYESGQNPVRSELLEKLIQVLDVEPNVLFQDIYRGRASRYPGRRGGWWSGTGG